MAHGKRLTAAGICAAACLGVVVSGCGGASEAGDRVTVIETATETGPAVTVTKEVAKPPPSSGVKVSYGEWEGLFKIYGARVVSSYGTPSVLGPRWVGLCYSVG